MHRAALHLGAEAGVPALLLLLGVFGWGFCRLWWGGGDVAAAVGRIEAAVVVGVQHEAPVDQHRLDADLDGFEPDYKRTGFGYVAGLGIGTPMGVSLGIRYNSDLSKLYDEGDAKIHNDVFMLTLGYTIGAR